MEVISQVYYSSLLYELIYWAEHFSEIVLGWGLENPINNKSTLVQVPLLGAVRQQAIIWHNVDPNLWRHMESLGHNELIVHWKILWKNHYRYYLLMIQWHRKPSQTLFLFWMMVFLCRMTDMSWHYTNVLFFKTNPIAFHSQSPQIWCISIYWSFNLRYISLSNLITGFWSPYIICANILQSYIHYIVE